MSPATLARLAVAGSRTDLLRTALTTVSTALAMVALLGAATVVSITGYAERYTNPLLVEPGLRPGVTIALILVALPVLALAGQCVRLGAPARDRRLAAIRLAGATPGEAVLIAIAETGVAGLLGSGAGLVAYTIGRRLIEQRDVLGRLRLPTDVLPPVAVVVMIALVVPVLAALVGALLMRRVILTPLGVVRRTRISGPRPWPGLLIVGGLGFVAVLRNGERFGLHASHTLLYVLLVAGVLAVIVGVVLGTGWISHTAGRLLRRHGRGPATLLAGQRLITDPWNGSRTLATLLAAVVCGAVTLGIRALMATEFRAYDLYNARQSDPSSGGIGAPEPPSFYFGAIRLVMIVVGLVAAAAAAGMLIALAESIVARRRSYAALTATGVPRRTLSAAVLWQTLTPVVPAVLLAAASGITLPRIFETRIVVGGDFERCIDPAQYPPECLSEIVHDPVIALAVPVPFDQLTLLGTGALLAVLLAAGVGLLVLRSSTDLEELRVG